MLVNENTIVVKKKKFIRSTMILAYSFVTVNHSEISDLQLYEKKATGQVIFSMAVFPSEIADRPGTYITISEMWLDNIKLEGFTKQTIELSAYQEGDLKILYQGNIEVGSYKSVTLIFDKKLDQKNNFPGCYFLDEHKRKHELTGINKTKIISLKKEIKVTISSPTEVVISTNFFNLINGDMKTYFEQCDLISRNNMDDSFKLSLKNECAEIKGEITNFYNAAYEMYVVAFKKGSFQKVANDKILKNNIMQVKNASSWSKIKPYGGYQLSLLEEGEYDINIMAYDNKTGSIFWLKGFINRSSNISGILLNNIKVTAKSMIQLNIDIIGVI